MHVHSHTHLQQNTEISKCPLLLNDEENSALYFSFPSCKFSHTQRWKGYCVRNHHVLIYQSRHFANLISSITSLGSFFPGWSIWKQNPYLFLHKQYAMSTVNKSSPTSLDIVQYPAHMHVFLVVSAMAFHGSLVWVRIPTPSTQTAFSWRSSLTLSVR